MSRYEFRLPYAASETLAAAFPEFELVQIGSAQTLLTGSFDDLTEVHSLLERAGDLGLEISEFRRTDT